MYRNGNDRKEGFHMENEEVRELVRVNTRISADLNDWLDNESKRTGLSKSAIMMIATEGYRKERDVVKSMNEFSVIYEEMNKLKSVFEQKGLE
jgi:hypothetical protein